MDPGFIGDGRTVAVAERSSLTFGVEEEFLLLDASSGVNLPVGDDVLARLTGQASEQSRHEFRQSMIEMVTPVCGDLQQMREHLAASRKAAGDAAAAIGAQLVAVGATPVAEAAVSRPAAERYERIIRQFGPVALDPALCGMHVHVGVPDRELAVQVCNHLRPWLPVVQALTVNSPFHAGADTGYASWRSIQMERWPSLGPSPYFASAAEYDDAVQQLITAGVMLDEGMVLWYARPSARYPTVEVRVADVLPTVDDAVVVAGLVRALVATVTDDIRAGLPAPRLRTSLLSAAHWRAARDGIEGQLVNPLTGVLSPAWELVDDLMSLVGPALTRDGDLQAVTAGIDRLRVEGSGAERQRRIHRAGGDLHDVLVYLAGATTGSVAR
ncbi:carboxylate-amine ligase [Catellatospora methionotrophica]|uniref:carboxylate-amine ligase n=1 Tax=Catellatospora methionotrophica TaxID=121620 RepID=UPI0033CE47B0